MIKLGVVKPTPEEEQELMAEAENTPPDPQQKLVESLANQANAEAANFDANTIKSLADADLKVAQTAETYAGITNEEQRIAVEAVQTLANLGVEEARAKVDEATASPSMARGEDSE